MFQTKHTNMQHALIKTDTLSNSDKVVIAVTTTTGTHVGILPPSGPHSSQTLLLLD